MFSQKERNFISFINITVVILIYVVTNAILWKIGYFKDAASFYILSIVFIAVSVVVGVIAQIYALLQVKVIYQGLNKLAVDPNYRLPKMYGKWGNVAEYVNQLADSLISTRNLMDKVINQLPVAVVAVDKAGKLIMCNPAAKQLFQCKQCSWTAVAESKNCPGHLLEWTLNTLNPVTNYDYSLETPENDTKQVLINTELIRGTDGDCIAALLTANDITSRQQMLEQMQQAEKLSMISELAAGVAHEIKNPLTSARGLLQFLSGCFKEENIARQHIKVALEGMDRINLIINELEQLSQPSKPILTFNQLEGLMDEILVLIESEAVYHNVTVERIYQLNLPLAVIDVTQMKQVFLNLGINAINAMPKGGKLIIRISYNAADNEFEISFKDNGVGMSKSEIKKIFDPFYTSKENSTGLGLTVCYQLVKNHGGRINVQSQKNKGSVFKIYLPAVNQAKKTS